MISPNIVTKVLETVEPQEVIDLTASLVKINSVWDPVAGTSEQAAAECAARWAEEQGFQVVVEEVAPGRPNVIVTHDAGPGPRTLMFEGHIQILLRSYDASQVEIVLGSFVRKLTAKLISPGTGNEAKILKNPMRTFGMILASIPA